MMRRVEERDEMRADVRVQCAAAIESRGTRERRTWREREMEMGMERREEKECKSERTAHEHETTKEKQGKTVRRSKGREEEKRQHFSSDALTRSALASPSALALIFLFILRTSLHSLSVVVAVVVSRRPPFLSLLFSGRVLSFLSFISFSSSLSHSLLSLSLAIN